MTYYNCGTYNGNELSFMEEKRLMTLIISIKRVAMAFAMQLIIRFNVKCLKNPSFTLAKVKYSINGTIRKSPTIELHAIISLVVNNFAKTLSSFFFTTIIYLNDFKKKKLINKKLTKKNSQMRPFQYIYIYLPAKI